MSRANQTYPYEKKGQTINGKIDELMLEHYRVPDGSPEGAVHVEAFEVGQQLQYYFAVYSCVMVNENIKDTKMNLPTPEHAVIGLEAPLVLMLDNEFFRHNYQVILSSMLAEIARMSTCRQLGADDGTLAYSLSLCKWEFLSTIAGLVSGSKSQKEMDLKMREFTSVEMETAMRAVRNAKGKMPI